MRRLWPWFAAMGRGRVLYKDRSGRRRLFLTFDDGPCPEHTPRIVRLLAQHGAKATFFMIGQDMLRYPELVGEVVREGHEIGNHSMTHRRFSWATARARREETEAVDALVRAQGLPGKPAFRLPFAEDSFRLVLRCLVEGHRVALWSRDSLDYRLDAEAVIRGFSEVPVSPGDVILFHDDGPAAALALATLLPRWIREGYSFGRLSEIA